MGWKAHPVDIVPESRYFIGMEIQGSRRTLCLLDYRGRPLYTSEDAESCQDYGRNMAAQALSACGLRLEDISSMGVCLPGRWITSVGYWRYGPASAGPTRISGGTWLR